MKTGEPPCRSSRASPLYLIGKNSRGQWVVREQGGLCGGLFVSRAEAVKYAMYETGRRPQAVIMVPGILELNLNGERGTGEAETPLQSAA
ncbi:MAG: hypothetical protein K2Z80_32875 [Xanthobacteraceae bacterium]|nr:hypothetical protein [Xanthobacteraceae bacterium]